MADFDRNVLDFYGISTLMPTTWPAEKNDKVDDSDSDREQQKKKINRRKSRYDALERAVSSRASIVAGSEVSSSGVSNLVQRDEPDPLGSSDSVVRTLNDLGVPIQDDTRLRKFPHTPQPPPFYLVRTGCSILATRQAIVSCCLRRASRLLYSFLRCTPMPIQNLYYMASMFSPDRSIRNPLH